MDFKTFKSRTKELMIDIDSLCNFTKSLIGRIRELESNLLKGTLAYLGSN